MKVRPKTIDYKQLRLTAEEGFVLSRVDGPLSVRELVTLTGLPEDRVQEIVAKLATSGALDVEGGALPVPVGPPGPPAAAAAPGPAAASTIAAGAAKARAMRPELKQEVAAEPMTDDEQLPELEELPQDASLPPPPVVDEPPSDELFDGGPDAAADSSARLDEDENTSEHDTDEEGDAVTIAPEPPSAVNVEEQAQLDEEERGDKVWRRIYETVYRHMTREQRMSSAKTVTGDHLMAMCLDAEPQILHALLDNPRFGLAEARYVAFHHRTQTGLEMLTRNLMFLKDGLVQRRLLRNPQLPDMLLRKIINPKLLTDTYKIAIDREVPERSRIKTADVLRKKFTVAGGEEKAALVIKTEARCLIILAGCAFDAQTTQILCGRTSWSLMTIQNLARWSATPPQLLRMMLKLPIIRTNFGVRKMLLKHPNMPSDVKRAFQTGQ